MTLSFRWIQSMNEVAPAAWDALAAAHDYPFLRWTWLHHLEASGSAVISEGWQTQHLLCFDQDRLIGIAPLYLKSHSRGEFVFDSEWARVAHQVGVTYYPKLLGMSPFTPAVGYRFLTAADRDTRDLNRALLREINRFTQAKGLSGFSFLHGDAAWVEMMVELGMNPWYHHGLVWENHDFQTFDDYLASFRSHQRKNIRRERRKIKEQGVAFRVFSGRDIPDEYFDKMYQFYAATCVKYWGYSHYLKQEFFRGLAADFREHTAFVCAYVAGIESPIAMSFLIHEGDWVFGRYWGSLEEFDFLHFETCYYQPIEWAIQQGFRYYDAGSGGGRQKKSRGFPAQLKPSLHRFHSPIMQRIWADNIEHLNSGEMIQIELINDYKKTVARLEKSGLIER
ncbi:GNAT family N-acetyltransferase [Acanthopleuribacter pedis]|uniref:GNAT family N-acetyltransferase n=1 Tax=Acanthopleuribacter pedis TaxID=442870 RepID=A0A8J7Q8I9_9BACT|nr:GNAT family N-acetyltransferase [Acanthopleuribacter pedis]MBO1318859.1 GNAT family N-acetyltransferase [Acanthopleuribacter pedis]